VPATRALAGTAREQVPPAEAGVARPAAA